LVPRSRFAVSHFLGCAVFLRRTAPGTFKRPAHPLGEFRLPSECRPTDPSLPATASGLLSWALAPFSTCRAQRSTAAGDAIARYGPSTGFGYPLDGFRPLSPGRLSFTPAALLGFCPSELSPPERYRRRFRQRGAHLPFAPVGIPAAEAEGRPNEPRLLGFDPFERPWRPAGVSSPNRWMLPWAFPS